jgi:Skp family chaperone for outer membrane proteins
MRNLVIGAALCLAAAAPCAQAQPAQALPTPTVVVVDMTQIMRESKAAKDIQAQIEKEMNGYSREVANQENALKSLRDELERQRTVLAPDVFNMKSQEYQQRYAALDRDVQQRRQEMQQSYSEAMTKVETAALHIVADVAKERKANMVVAKAALLYMDDAYDVTPEVTQRLDQKFPAMAVNLRKPGDETTATSKTPPPTAKK